MKRLGNLMIAEPFPFAVDWSVRGFCSRFLRVYTVCVNRQIRTLCIFFGDIARQCSCKSFIFPNSPLKCEVTVIVARNGSLYVLDLPLSRLEEQVDSDRYFGRTGRYCCRSVPSRIDPYFKEKVPVTVRPPYKEKISVSKEKVAAFKVIIKYRCAGR